MTFAVLGLVGVLSGVLRGRLGRHRRRYEILVTIQRTLADEAPLDLSLARLRAALADRLRVDEIALVACDGERLAVAGGARVADRSLVARVLATGEPVFVSDAGARGRARRAFATPLMSRGRAVGVLAVERTGEISVGERVALEAVGAHVGVALENARLVSCQRRFAAELEERVTAARRELEELDRAKSAFVAIASHELRTPLTALQGFSEILALRRLPPEEVTRLAEVMRREARRLGRIVSDLLDLSRIERGLEPALCRVPLEIEPTIEATVDLFRQGTATHLITTECEPSLPLVAADPDALERVLTNLISNAIKYSPTGSSVPRGCARARRRGGDRGRRCRARHSDRGVAARLRALLSGARCRGRGARHRHRPGRREGARRGSRRNGARRQHADDRHARDGRSPRAERSVP